ncbi:hypothetical protein XELAEV_18029656mg [Xenopus laevis]|nr:hypothetical protein XELAEV_18029656mg [Xenopus laevis]
MDDAIQTFSEYGQDAYLFNKGLERYFTPSDFLANQPKQHAAMWQEVTNTLIKVHRHFSLDFSILCLAINYRARYISCRTLKATMLKLLGATSLFLATKVMERNGPSAEEFLEPFGEASYTPEYIAYVEKHLIYHLEFRLQGPTIDFFLEHFSLMRVSDKKCSQGNIIRTANSLTAARGIAALAMTKYDFHPYAPSLLAQCCLKAADQIFGYSNIVGEESSDYPAHLMQECLEKTLLLVSANKNVLQQLMPGVFPEKLPQQSTSPTNHNGSQAVNRDISDKKTRGVGSSQKKPAGGRKSAAKAAAFRKTTGKLN